VSPLSAPGFPARAIRRRARLGAAAVFPDAEGYGHTLYGESSEPGDEAGPAEVSRRPDDIDRLRLVPPVFVPRRLEKLIDLAREPLYRDVDLDTRIGGFRSRLPVYLSAFGSTQVASRDLGRAAAAQAGRAGIPMVVGENVVPVNGYGRAEEAENALLGRIRAYADEVEDGVGGVVVQQSTEDADAEVWNLVYSDPNLQDLLESDRLAFELKVGQGAKPGLGGLTVVDRSTAGRLAEAYQIDDEIDLNGSVLRCSSPGTFTEEILRQQIRLMHNNYPRARVWVKLPPARDVRGAAQVAWTAGADAVTVDSAEGGSGWAPRSFLDHVGLPLAECLRQIGRTPDCLLVSGRIWEGARAAKALALGATAVGLGRAALLAVDEDPEQGLSRLLTCLGTELQMLTSALGKYHTEQLAVEDLWCDQPAAAPAELLDARTR
jgi:isopentenyl diphosphate isomerase/L-lactate dehydrogenase-like FMN-dependent dehydrogenase